MKFQCENCGHMNDVDVQQTIAARARWAEKSKAERSAESEKSRPINARPIRSPDWR